MVRSSSAVWASILGGLREPHGPWGAATSVQDNTVTTRWWRLVCRHGERISICVRKDQPHHRWWPRGDTSHSRPAPCDVALEVSWGQTGSPSWYPVLSARLCVKCRDTKMPGRSAWPQGILSLVAENTPTLSVCPHHGLSISPPRSPPGSRTPQPSASLAS